ncbi:MAG: helix-turn-helix domain-containing protein [Methanomicrobiales archaeon]|nr:helix-turn-helix domain-containing protein [Methanomicrobiales archaeon]
MEDYTGLELSPRKVEYLKYLSGQGGSAKISELSGHFGVDPSTATRTVQELTWEGFVHHEPYGDVVLTGFGEEYSAFLLRRHRGHPTTGLCGEITHDALCRPEVTAVNCHEKVS